MGGKVLFKMKLGNKLFNGNMNNMDGWIARWDGMGIMVLLIKLVTL